MEKELLNQIIIKYQQGKASPDEIKFIEAYYQALEHRADRDGVGNQLPSAQTWTEIHQHIDSSIQHHESAKTIRLWKRISVVAAVLGLIAVGIYFYVKPGASDQDQIQHYATDIAPGQQGATLTLANGEKIRLSQASNGELAKQAGVTISKTASGQLIYEFKPSTRTETDPGAINTLTTAKGETYQVRLPDGSLVWLNAASSLTYTAALTERRQRRVKLSGEAYFEVAKDKVHPFIVESNQQEVEVLGTHFNISSYPDDAASKTTLLEGSVRVSARTKGVTQHTKILKPNQQSTLIGATLSVSETEGDYAIAWKEGFFMFNNESLESAMSRIARWYNVQVLYDDEEAKGGNYFGRISRYENVSKVLKMLSRTDLVNFKIEGKIIKISTKKIKQD